MLKLFRPPRDPKVDRLVNWRIIFFSYLLIGVFQALAGFSSYFWIMAQHGFDPWRLIGIRTEWEDPGRYVRDSEDRLWVSSINY